MRKNKARERFGEVDPIAYKKVLDKLTEMDYVSRQGLVALTGLSDVENRRLIRAIRWEQVVLTKKGSGYRLPRSIQNDVDNTDYKEVCKNIKMINNYIEALKMDLRALLAYKKEAEKIKPELMEQK